MSESRSSPLSSPARLFKMPTPQTESKDITWRFVAHRGANNAAPGNTLIHLPENTLPAMQEAYKVGAHYVECDVHMTRDQRIVVLHDDTLRRTASYNPTLAKTLTRERFEHILDTKIPELSYEDEVSQVTVGAYNAAIPEAYHATPISPLEDFLAQLKANSNKRLIIELKAGDVAIIAVLQKLIERYTEEYHLKAEQLIFISFDYDLIAASKKALSPYKHLFLTIATPDADQVRPDPNNANKTLGYYYLIKDKTTLEQYIKMAKDAGLDGLDVEYDSKLVDADFIHAIHSQQLLCAIWTNSKDDNLTMAKHMLDAGANYINTNQPQYVFEQLQPAELAPNTSPSKSIHKSSG
jgi:glycerophosphoryl diester phosphodiesterase